MKRTVLKYTGAKSSVELGSAMIPESTLVVRSVNRVKTFSRNVERVNVKS